MKLSIYLTNPVDYAQGANPNFFADTYGPESTPSGWLYLQSVEISAPNKDAVLEKALWLIDKTETEAKLQHKQKMDQIQDQKNKLLALEVF